MFNFQDYKAPVQDGIRLPKFSPSLKDLELAGCKDGADNFEILRKLCFKGVKSLGIDKKADYDKYIERTKYELKILKDLCLVDYMLIVWDYLNFCKVNNIPRGPARGSCGGCLVAYLIGITEKVDPIKYKLLFERFLSIDRVQPKEIDGVVYLKDCADIDTDISYVNRPRVVEYIESKYAGQTAQILTLATLSGKLCVKECAKLYLMLEESAAQRISDMVERTFGVVQPLKQVYEENPAFREWADQNPEAYKIARKIEGLNKNCGVHASGIAISPCPREELFPCQKTSEGVVVTGWEMGTIGEMAVKIDCLGLRTLDVLEEASKASGVLLSSIDPEDPTIYEQFKNLDHQYGLFQIETDAGIRITKEIQPEYFGHLSDIVAINRPGAIIFLKDYVAYKRGEKEIPKLHPIIDEILRDTGGVLLMQEQTMRILHEVYGFSLVEANQLRKVIGKKLRNEVGAWEEKIRARGTEKGIADSITVWYWSSIKASADYQFNACLDIPTTYVNSSGKKTNIGKIKVGDQVLAYDVSNGRNHFVIVEKIHLQKAVLVRVESHHGQKITCSLDHKFLCNDGRMRPLWQVISENWQVFNSEELSHLFLDEIIGLKDSIDLEVDSPDHNFYANNIVVSNSHSKAYSYITAQCAWFKANRPKEFFLGALKLALSESKPQDIINIISQELPRFGIKLLPPDLALSKMDFSIEGPNIRYGLSAIKGIGEKKLESLEKFRGTDRPNKYDIFLAAREAKIGIGVLSSLIQAGTLDNFGTKRTRLVLEAQVFNQLTEREKKTFVELGPKYQHDSILTLKECTKNKFVDSKGKEIIPEKRLNTLREKSTKYFEIERLNSAHENLTNWYFERKLLGYAYSVKLKNCFEAPLLDSTAIKNMSDWSKGLFIGTVVEVSKNVSAKGNPYMKLLISDESGNYAAMMIDNKKHKKFTEFIDSGAKMPEEEDIVMLNCAKSGDILFIDGLKIVSDQVYLKLSDLKDQEDASTKGTS